MKLHDLVADYGRKWKVIGQLMNRSGPACRDKWRITLKDFGSCDIWFSVLLSLASCIIHRMVFIGTLCILCFSDKIREALVLWEFCIIVSRCSQLWFVYLNIQSAAILFGFPWSDSCSYLNTFWYLNLCLICYSLVFWIWDILLFVCCWPVSNNPWSDEEQQQLKEAVHHFIGKNRLSLASFQCLPWTAVADYVGTRTWWQCRKKWCVSIIIAFYHWLNSLLVLTKSLFTNCFVWFDAFTPITEMLPSDVSIIVSRLQLHACAHHLKSEITFLAKLWLKCWDCK